MPPRQSTLFAEPTPTLDVAVRFAQVAVPLPVRGAFTYTVPSDLVDGVVPGVRVAVPFGARRLVGFVVGISDAPPAGVDLAKMRPVHAVLDTESVFPDELFRFLREAADYYLYPVGEVLRAAAPAVDARERANAGRTAEGGTMGARWATVRQERFVRLVEGVEAAPKGPRQSHLLALLASRGEVPMRELRVHVKDAPSVVRALVARGLVTSETREIPADPFFGNTLPRDVPPVLTASQGYAVETIVGAIERHERTTFLIHGVTGSGKTEVYLRAIDAAQRKGHGALILLPEIALTPQLVSRYRARFGDDVAVLHSGLKDADRFAMWRKLRSGACRVAIGARSAIFAPIENLGVVIVDEEHDGSFKQDDHFKYHGRDLALLRAHRAGVVCVLGSATPSIESYHAAREGRFELLELPDRATAASMPTIEIVDLRRSGVRSGILGTEMLTLPLVRALDETLSRKEQAIIFLNRRGFAPSVRCEACGVIECPSCSVALVLHRREGLLRCHYCDFTRAFTGACPKCEGVDLALIGAGTEKIEQALVNAFPAARIGRLDRDVASTAGAESVIERLRSGEIDVLVGTQMVTKGHDIARVTLVGVIAADSTLSFPDFRASERTFQLLSQVAGRAGRASLPGRVIIQTYDPTHMAVRHAQAHDFVGFYNEEITARRELGYPPFGRLAAVRLDAVEEPRVRQAADLVARELEGAPEVRDGRVRVLGPAPSPLERLRKRFRMQLLVRAPTRAPLRAVLTRLAAWLEKDTPAQVRIAIDVDPVQML